MYFVTFRSARGDLPEEARRAVIDVVLHDHDVKYKVISGVVMPNHVHLLIQPMEVAPGRWYDLHLIMKSIKGVSARHVNQLMETSGSLWRDESFDRIVRDESELQEKFRYIINNPVKAGLAGSPGEYEFYVDPSAEAGPH